MPEYDLVEIDFSNSDMPFFLKGLLEQVPESYPHRKGLLFCSRWLEGVQEFDFQTSGSTGEAKRMRVAKERIIASVETTAKFLGLQLGCTSFICLNTDFTGGKMMLARALHLKMKVYLVSPQRDPFELFPKNVRIDIMPLSPIQMAALLERADGISLIGQVENILLGGAAVSDEVRAKIKPLNRANVFESFGMTETLSHIALKRLNGPQKQTSFKLLDGITVDKDERNCLLVKGKVTEDHWISTNDIVDIIDANHFVWKGRIDNVINSGGVKIQLEEVETLLFPLLGKLGYKGEFLLSGKEDPLLGTRLVLFVEEKFLDEISALQFLKQNLPLYHAPKEIFHVNRLPRTTSGKLKRII